MRAYVARVGDVTSANELASLLREVSEHHGPWGLERVDGLAEMLWSLRDILRNVRSFLYVGTHYGYVFVVMREFLRTRNPDARALTIDTHNFVISDVADLVASERLICSSSSVFDRKYDWVVLCGCQPFSSFYVEFSRIGLRARVCVILHATSAWWWTAFCNKHAPRVFGTVAVVYNQVS